MFQSTSLTGELFEQCRLRKFWLAKSWAGELLDTGERL